MARSTLHNFFINLIPRVFNERMKIKEDKCKKRIKTLFPFKTGLKRPLVSI